MPEKRFSRTEARAAVLEAGMALIIDRGPSLGLDRVTFAEAIERSGVPRPSAYRAFSDPAVEPQKLFRNSLATQVVMGAAFADLSRVSDAVQELVAAAQADDAAEEELSTLLREVVRVGSAAYMDHCLADPVFPAYFAILATMLRDGFTERAEVHQVERDASDHFTAYYQSLFAAFGLRLRSTWDWPQFTAALNMATTGDYLMGDILMGRETHPRPTGPNGEDQEWTMFALILESIFVASAEPDPKMVVSADPRRWVS